MSWRAQDQVLKVAGEELDTNTPDTVLVLFLQRNADRTMEHIQQQDAMLFAFQTDSWQQDDVCASLNVDKSLQK